MYKITFYVPESHLEAVKNAMFQEGAGKIGNYEHCAWQTLGIGQYRPLKGSDPYQGTIGQLEREEEYLVEMVCEETFIEKVLNALKKAHPYETPAYSFWKIHSDV